MPEHRAQRRTGLEDWIKAVLPYNSQATLTSSDGWDKADGPLTATLHVRTRGYANQPGRRLLLPLSYFKTSENKSFFASAPDPYPVQSYDAVRFTPPESFTVETAPAALSIKGSVANVDLKAEKVGRDLQITRKFVLDGNYFPRDGYFGLRDFFQKMALADEGQAILQRAAPPVASLSSGSKH